MFKILLGSVTERKKRKDNSLKGQRISTFFCFVSPRKLSRVKIYILSNPAISNYEGYKHMGSQKINNQISLMKKKTIKC